MPPPSRALVPSQTSGLLPLDSLYCPPMFPEMKLSDFLEKIAAKTPTPGGGSVSAAVGAMGAALGVMTARYSDASEPEHALDEIKNEFLVLVDADAEAYGQVNSALALPK